MEPMACSLADAAKASGLSRETLYRRINDGALDSVRVGGRRLIKVASLRRLLGEAA